MYLIIQCSIWFTLAANKEAAIIVNKKYQGILDVLKSEQAKWPYAMLTMEKHHKQARAELLSLQAMLEDAVRVSTTVANCKYINYRIKFYD